MSAWQIKRDHATLPKALLPLAKQQMRVEFDRDDGFIEKCIARAIGLLEQKWGLRIFGAEIGWQPPIGRTVVLPVQPVASVVVRDSGGADVSAEFALRYDSLVSPWFFVRRDGGAIGAGLDVTLKAGYTDPDALPPEALDGILRVSAMLYEFRESVGASTLAAIPRWMDDLLVGLWVPRA